MTVFHRASYSKENIATNMIGMFPKAVGIVDKTEN